MWFTSWSQNPNRQASPSKRPIFRPTLEALEQRWMPSTLTVTNNLDSGARLSGNAGSDAGGGITECGTLTASGGSTLTGNTALVGGGIYNQGVGTLTVGGSTLSGNSVYQHGGGIYNSGTATVSGGSIL